MAEVQKLNKKSKKDKTVTAEKDEILKSKISAKELLEDDTFVFKRERKPKRPAQDEIIIKKTVSAEEILSDDKPLKRERKGRPYTVSVALPASIVANAQSHELRAYLVGQIARACTVQQIST